MNAGIEQRATELRNIGSAIVQALARIVNAPQTDEQFDANVIPRSFVIDQALLIKEQYDKILPIAAALQAQQPGAQAVAWAPNRVRTEVYEDGKWRTLCVYGFSRPDTQPPSIPEPSEEDVEAARDAFDKAVRAKPAMVPADPSAKWTTDLMRAALTTYTARLRERIGGGS
jgi:hypothetical protein